MDEEGGMPFETFNRLDQAIYRAVARCSQKCLKASNEKACLRKTRYWLQKSVEETKLLYLITPLSSISCWMRVPRSSTKKINNLVMDNPKSLFQDYLKVLKSGKAGKNVKDLVDIAQGKVCIKQNILIRLPDQNWELISSPNSTKLHSKAMMRRPYWLPWTA